MVENDLVDDEVEVMNNNSSGSNNLLTTPSTVVNILQEKLNASDREIVSGYIRQLQNELRGRTSEDVPMNDVPITSNATTSSTSAADRRMDVESTAVSMPPIYTSGVEDYDKAATLKQEASDLKDSGDYEKALEKYTEAILAAPPSALLYANRATVLLKLGQYKAAERDCDLALNENPDSAKALRVRGKARKEMGLWELALKDLSSSQTIDFDEGTVQDLKFLAEKHIELEKQEADERNKEKEKLHKRADEIRKAQEEAKREQQQQNARGSSSMPGGGFAGMPGGGFTDMPNGAGAVPGGMPNMDVAGLMGTLMSDPELLAGMQNPKVRSAFQELMSGPGGPMGVLSNPGKLQELLSDPEVGPVMQKLIAKLGPSMGMGGAGGMGGMGGAGMGHGNADDDVPDMSAMPEMD